MSSGPQVFSFGFPSDLRDEALKRIEGLRDLPTLPAIVQRVMMMAQDVNVSFRELKQVIIADPPLAAKILKVANSAFYSRRVKATSIDQALVTIGLQQVISICSSMGVMKALDAWEEKILDRENLWRHALATGFLAKGLEPRKLANNDKSPDIFLAGLLHNIGWIVIDYLFHDKMQNILRTAEEVDEWTLDHEVDILGMDHAELGSIFLEKWGLPSSLCDIVANHHNPDAPTNYQEQSSIIQTGAFLAPFTFRLEPTLHEINEIFPQKLEKPGTAEGLEEVREKFQGHIKQASVMAERLFGWINPDSKKSSSSESDTSEPEPETEQKEVSKPPVEAIKKTPAEQLAEEHENLEEPEEAPKKGIRQSELIARNKTLKAERAIGGTKTSPAPEIVLETKSSLRKEVQATPEPKPAPKQPEPEIKPEPVFKPQPEPEPEPAPRIEKQMIEKPAPTPAPEVIKAKPAPASTTVTRAQRPQVQHSAQPRPEQPRTENTTTTVLLVETDGAQRIKIADVLAKKSIKTMVATSGNEAAAFIERTLPDSVLLSMSLPPMDIRGLIKIIKKHELKKHIPIIAITKPEQFQGIMKLNLAVDDILFTPLNIKELLARTEAQIVLGKRLKTLREQERKQFSQRSWPDMLEAYTSHVNNSLMMMRGRVKVTRSDNPMQVRKLMKEVEYGTERAGLLMLAIQKLLAASTKQEDNKISQEVVNYNLERELQKRLIEMEKKYSGEAIPKKK